MGVETLPDFTTFAARTVVSLKMFIKSAITNRRSNQFASTPLFTLFYRFSVHPRIPLNYPRKGANQRRCPLHSLVSLLTRSLFSSTTNYMRIIIKGLNATGTIHLNYAEEADNSQSLNILRPNLTCTSIHLLGLASSRQPTMSCPLTGAISAASAPDDFPAAYEI